jgi:hypothetical protein
MSVGGRPKETGSKTDLVLNLDVGGWARPREFTLAEVGIDKHLADTARKAAVFLGDVVLRVCESGQGSGLRTHRAGNQKAMV